MTKQHDRPLSWASALGFLIVALLGPGFATAGQGDAPEKVAPRASGQRTGKPSAPAASTGAASLIPTSVLEKIPTRASGADARPGDFVNFLIVGTEADMKLAFQAAGWRIVDRTKTDTAPSPDRPASPSQNEYLTMPLSQQSLFGKSQDYSFVLDALVALAPARHDVRIWKAPFAVNGQPLWVGAASHEGPWWNNTAAAVSYTADPNLDDERDFLGSSLRVAGLVERSEYVASVGEPAKTRPAASDSLRTDGRVFVMALIHL